MPSEFTTTVFYQSGEEVLESSVLYIDLGAAPERQVNDCKLIAEAIKVLIQNEFDGIMSNGWRLHAVSVTTASNIAAQAGPRRFDSISALESEGGASGPGPDSMVMNCSFPCQNGSGQPNTGGIRLSGAPKLVLDCNGFEISWFAQANAMLAAAFPQQLAVGGVGTLFLGVRRKTDPGPDGLYISTEVMKLNPLPGVRKDRKANTDNSFQARVVV
jgi:hypothetical protein